MQSNIYWLYPLIIIVMMTILYFVAQRKGDNSIVDIFWGLGFCILAANSFLWAEDYDVRKGVTLLLVLVWGLRLSIFIYKRNKGKPEDFRYVEMRKNWGGKARVYAFFQVFMLQGFIMFIIALPILHIQNFSTPPFTLLDALGIIVWAIGFYFEAVGDRQKYLFAKDPANKGKFIQSGLWNKSRHPNYFGEILMWWGIFLLSAGCARWYLSLISPIVMTLLLTKVSGVPLLEKKYAANPEYQEYKKRVSALIPKLL